MNISENLRIRRFDDKNIVLEKKNEKDKWIVVGYFQNVIQAIECILRKDMLIDLNEIKSLSALSTSFSEQIRQVEGLIKEAEEIVL